MSIDKLIKEIRSKGSVISVSINDCDLLNVSDQIKQIEKSGVDMIHFSVKDGCFVPEITFGPCFIKAVKTNLLKDVHLMIHEPDEKVDEFLKSGADIITLHIESGYSIQKTFRKLTNYKSFNNPERSIIRGIAINPDIPLEDVAPFLDSVELVSLMAYNPKVLRGKIDDKLQQRVKAVKMKIDNSKKDIFLAVNGGVDKKNIKIFSELGVDIFVIGKPVYENELILDNIISIKNALEEELL